MNSGKRISIGRNVFAQLISEVNGLCPLCSQPLIVFGAKGITNLSQAAHIYPHSPTKVEKAALKNVPLLSSDIESPENLIMLCHNCHHQFDHPRTTDEYMQLYHLKSQILKRHQAQQFYQKHDIESDILSILNSISVVDVETNTQKLSYNVMTVTEKMSKGSSYYIQQLVKRNVRDYYIPIREALVQLEMDSPGKSELIAKEISVFYTELKTQGFDQDQIYYSIIDWLDHKTKGQFTLLIPYLAAYYIQNCEVFSP